MLSIRERESSEELGRLWRRFLTYHQAEILTDYLSKHSGLPGPRGNITLAIEVSRLIAADWISEERFLHLLVEDWVSSGDEYLMFTAHMALGYVLSISPAEELWALPILYEGNFNKRWRAREGVTFALEELLARRRGFALALIDKWCVDSNPIVIRNAIVALAHPCQIRESVEQLDVLKKFNRIGMELVASLDKTPDLKMLAKSLGFTLSIVAEADESYLKQLEEWIVADVKPWSSIVKVNLGKARIAKKYPECVASLRRLIG